jgi:uncharacterized membrane protein
MSTYSSTGLYQEDLYCSNPSNLITNEVQTLQTPGLDDYYFIIPHAAPYYVETLVLMNHANGVPYAEGVDYVIGHYFVDAMNSLKRPIAGSIRLLKKSIAGNVRIKYHTVGGQWGFNANAILAELSNKQLNPITRSWEQIDGLPARFPSIAHDQSVDKLVGSDDIEDAILGIAAAVEAAASGSSASHIAARNNPHQVTAAQVGLGSVVNLPLATLAQAVDQNFTGGYTTPRTVYQAINSFALTPLNTHIANLANPHQVSKAQVGLALTPNMALSNAAQATDPLNNTVLMSPYTTALMIQATMPTGRLDNLELALNNFIARRDNPHVVTAAQVGTLTTQQIQDLITGSGSGDAIRFNGYNFTQFMDLVVQETEAETQFNAAAVAIADGTTLINAIASTYVTDLNTANQARNILKPKSLYAGDGGYAVTGGLNETHLKALPALTFPPIHNAGTDGQIIQNNNVLSIAANGSITKSNVAGTLTPHASYATGGSFVVANAAQKIVATKTAIYIQCADGRLVRSTGAANATQLNATCENVWCNVENAAAGEMVVFQDAAGTLYSYGLAAWVTAFNAVIAAWVTAGIADTLLDMVISDTHILALFGTQAGAKTVKVYTINRTSGVVLTNVAAAKTGPVGVSGCYGHCGILYDDGTAAWYGTLPACENEVDITIGDFACGKGFTVFIDERSNVEFWGSVAGNALDWNEEVMYEHV